MKTLDRNSVGNYSQGFRPRNFFAICNISLTFLMERLKMRLIVMSLSQDEQCIWVDHRTLIRPMMNLILSIYMIAILTQMSHSQSMWTVLVPAIYQVIQGSSAVRSRMCPGSMATRQHPGWQLAFMHQICLMNSWRLFHRRDSEYNSDLVKGHEHRWMLLTLSKFQVWITIYLMMGISPKPHQAQHWSKDGLHEAPFFPKTYVSRSLSLDFHMLPFCRQQCLWQAEQAVEA